MKVLIVAKTRQHPGACIGAISFEGRSLRLLPLVKNDHEAHGREYNVGDVWEIQPQEPDDSRRRPPPHVEGVIVRHKRPLPPLADPVGFICERMPPHVGPPQPLFDGLMQRGSHGHLYIAERSGVPTHSTAFWIPDRPLTRELSPKRIRYRYDSPDWTGTFVFVGFEEAAEIIPAGSLVRVSLAHWWRPTDQPDWEERCYVQLSGWFPAPYSQEEEIPLSPPAPSPATSGGTPMPAMPTLDDARRTLKTVFGYDSFRPLQAEVIANVLGGRDTLLVMPTGGGKSLCYQLPALLMEGLTVVVSPLISLMQDQVEQLHAVDVPAAFLNSSLSYAEYGQTVAQVRSGQIRLLYMAPETLVRPESLSLLAESRVACLTIDEAHCISQWGHDFRPEYRQILDVRQRLPQAVCVAVTATATPRVQADIKASLGFSDPDTFIASFDRPNLFLSVQPRQNAPQQVMDFLARHKDESGIIYCATRKDVETVTALLNRRGVDALPYHAGLDDATRQQNQRRFIRDQVPVMVATVAFGMGIDKPDVRFVLHYSLPKDLESYYQQIGRAGRDGLPSHCLLLYSAGDLGTIRFFIQQAAEGEQRGASLRLQAMQDYAETLGCRRAPLLAYFGETYQGPRGEEACGECDNCQAGERTLTDLTIPAQKFLSCVHRTGQCFGVNHIIDVLRGSQAKRVLELGHDKLSTYNIGQEFSKEGWKFLARQFVQQGLMAQDLEHGGLHLTDKAYAVFKGEPVMGLLPQADSAAGQGRGTLRTPAPTEYDQDLFAQLRALRLRLADEANVPPYVIFGDRSLHEMAAYFPQTPERFLQIHGVGQAKLERYAEHFLPLIRAYCAERGLTEKEPLPPVAAPVQSRPAGKAGNRTYEIAAAFNDGQSVTEIAQSYGVQPRTVIDHLWKYAKEGNPLNGDGVAALSGLDPARQQQVLAAFAQHGPDFLRPVYEALGEQVPWDELHILRIAYVSGGRGLGTGD